MNKQLQITKVQLEYLKENGNVCLVDTSKIPFERIEVWVKK